MLIVAFLICQWCSFKKKTQATKCVANCEGFLLGDLGQVQQSGSSSAKSVIHVWLISQPVLQWLFH